jgi:hypothetical protein
VQVLQVLGVSQGGRPEQQIGGQKPRRRAHLRGGHNPGRWLSATAYACLGTNNQLAAANSTMSFLTSQFSTEICNAAFLQSQLYTAQGSIWSLNQQVLTANGDAITL